MGFDTDRMKLREVLKKSGNMKMGGSTTKKAKEEKSGAKVDFSNIKGKGIAEVKKGKQGSYGTKAKYESIVGNQGQLESSSGISPRHGQASDGSGIGSGRK